jgi:hypothetical protein
LTKEWIAQPAEKRRRRRRKPPEESTADASIAKPVVDTTEPLDTPMSNETL